MNRSPGRMVIGLVMCLALGLVGWGGAVASPSALQDGDELDPARGVPLPCEAVSTPGLAPRTAKNLEHVANVCGIVGTDVEFQSRLDASGDVRDYAFLGTMGFGLRIYDITDPLHPVQVGGFADPGWQNDVQVRGDLAVISVDPIIVAPTASACLQAKGASGGIDLVRLNYDPDSGSFETSSLGCVANNPGGAHNSTIHPSGEWIALSNPRTDGSVDVIDLRGGEAELRYRIVQDSTLASTSVCPQGAAFTCVSNGRAGNWSPHDVHFSRDGNTMYVAAVGDDTVLLEVSGVLEGQVDLISVIPNDNQPGGLANPENVGISHQSDVSADGKVLVIGDERGGGLGETSCNTDPNGVIGGAHFWALEEDPEIPASQSASPAEPVKLGLWVYPNPTLPPDPLEPVLATLPRAERACTIHLFRLGGNGTASPGPIQPGLDGVSRLPDRQLVTGHYGAGVWHLDFSAAPSSLDGTEEDPRSTWANTLGWNIMPGAETWSAKEYKGFVYSGDMTRGFDVYAFAECEGVECIREPAASTPGKTTGGGQLEDELAEFTIVRGTAVGGRANFGFNVQFETGDLVPSGHLTFNDHDLGKQVRSTAIDSLVIVDNRAEFRGLAEVDGVPGVPFFVEVVDMGEPGIADTFRIVLGDGYGAAGTLDRGNIQVH